MKNRMLCLFRWLLLVALLTGSAAHAATLEVLVDRDNNTATGCTVGTPGGAFGGVEQIFTTTVDTTVFPAKVTGIARTDCLTPPSTFSAPIAVDPGGWPVGVGTGTNGYDVVESYFTVSQQFGQYRLGFVYRDANTGQDALLNVNGQAGGAPILAILGPTPIIPTLTHGALLLLAFGLAFLALRTLRKHKASTLIVVGVLASIVAGTALAAVVLDGLINDWAGVPAIATDPLGDAPGGADISAVFIQIEAGRVFVRLDVKIATPPSITSANNTTFTVGSAGMFDITTFGIPPVNVITETGALPAGVNFVYVAGQPTASLSGTPGANTGGVYPLLLTAKNGVPPDATQNFTLTVNQAPAITSASSTTCFVGVQCTFTVTATGYPLPAIARSGGALPSGITYIDNGNGSGTLSGIANLGAVGAYQFSFTASNGVGSNAVQNYGLTVAKANSTTTVTSNQNPSLVGQPVTFTATVTAQGNGTPGGQVQFKDGANNLGAPVALDGTGKATLTTSALALGPHSITVNYLGDPNFNTSSGSLPTQTVNKAGTTTSLTSSVNPSVFGQSVTFTATVAITPPGVGTPTGTVQFKDGANNLGAPVAINGAGVATLTTSAIAVGAHPVTADYSGDPNFSGSTGTLLNGQVVNKASTATAVVSSVNPTVFGQQTMFTATITVAAPGAGTPTGTVQFLDGATPIGAPVAIAGGQASLSTAALSVGAHTINATYSGDGSFSTSTGSVAQTVNKANSQTTLTSGTNPSVSGNPVTFSATLAAVAPGAGTPSGSVSFFDGATLLGSSPLAAGVAQFTTSALTPGAHPNINTTYAGDANFNTSTGGPLAQTVNQPPTAVADSAYATLHDTNLVVPAATGVLANDNRGTPAATITAVGATVCPPYPCTVATAQGGSVSVLGDGSFTFTPKAFFAGNDTFTYTITNGLGSSSATVTVDVQDAAPVIDLDGAASAGINFGPVTFTEGGGAVAITGTVNPNWLTITDGDSANIGSATITLTNVQDIGAETLGFTCPTGPAPACSGAIQTTDIVVNPAATTITITRIAPPGDYEALLRSLTYNNTSLFPAIAPNRVITFRVDDRIKDNAPLAQTTVQVVGVNNAPAITAPAAVTTPKNTAFAFTAGNLVSVADADSGAGQLKLTIAVTNGTVTLTGVASTAGTAQTGTLTALNTALAGLTFTPTAGFTGLAKVDIDLDDQGNTGTGGAKTAPHKTINITVDTPPTVVSDPVNGATNVPTTKVIALTFSEPVTAAAGAFTLECPAGTPKAFNSNPALPNAVPTNTFNLTPGTPLAQNVSCTLTVNAASITDSVGQNLAANHVATFTTNTLPAVVPPTTPNDLATGVLPSTNIVIGFNESVSATGTAFTLECPVGVAKAFTQSASPATTYTLTPTVALPTSTTCTVTVVAAQITDSAGQNMAANYSFTFTVGTPPAFTSANNTAFTVGTPGTYPITASGNPGATITQGPGACAPALPAGVGFSGNLTLAGTPPAGSGGTYVCPLLAANGITPDATQSFTLTINEPPTAVNDPTTPGSPLYTTVHDTVLAPTAVNGMLSNDNRGFPLAAINKVQGVVCAAPCVRATAQAGSVTVNADGSFSYTPPANFAGTDTFTYTLLNTQGESAPATVTLTVTNVVPVADLNGPNQAGINFGPVTYTEGDGDKLIVPIVPDAPTLVDTDHANLASMTIKLTNLMDVGVETLKLVCPTVAPGCSGAILDADVVYTPTAADFTVSINKSAPIADYLALLRTLQYKNTSQNPTTAADASKDRLITVTVNDGIANNSPLANVTVHIVAVNNAPTLAGIEPGLLNYKTNSPAVAITASLTITDPDSANLGGATVQITTNCVPADDVLALPAQPGITGNYVASPSCLLTLTGTATLASYQTALRAVTYSNTNNLTPSNTRTVTFQATDDLAAASNTVSRGIAVSSNTAPVLTAGATLNYTENQAATAIDSTVTVTDDGTTLAGATITITGNYLNGEDVLSFTNAPPITGAFVAATGTLTLSGTDTLANYQTALRNVKYNNTSDNPSTLARTVTWQVNDGAPVNNLSNTPTSTINITAVNDAPVLAAATTLNYTENDPATVITNAITVNDLDSTTLTGATVQISANYVNGQDVLSFTNAPPITGAFVAATGTLTLSGTDTLANYQAALRSVKYNNTSDNPSTLARTVSWQANDGAGVNNLSNILTSAINVTAVNDAPVLANGSTLGYTENQAATAINTLITVNDIDSANLVGATIQITGNYVNGEDVLSFVNAPPITGAFVAGTGTLTLSGTDTLANYQAALRNVKYNNTSDNPSTLARTVSFQANDGGAVSNLSNIITSTVNVTAVNDAPVLAAAGTLNYTENDPATVITNAITVNDLDSTTLTGATIQISANYVNGQDVLSFTNLPPITGAFVAATGTLTLSGTDTLANYQAALRNVKYNNTSENPSTLARTVSWQANDGAGVNNLSNILTSTINVTAVNDAPVLANGSTLGYTENQVATAINTVITVNDIDSANLVGATIQITGNYANGQDVLSFTNAPPITGSFAAATGTLTLSGTDTLANYQAALRNVKYNNTSDDPSTLARTVSFQANDGGAVNNLSNIITSTINVTAVNDPPTATAFTNLPAQAGIPITYPAGKLGGTDLEAGTTITIDTTPGAVTNGTVTINANGSFTFTPSSSASGANGASFTYRVSDNGNPPPGLSSAYATVTFNVAGPAIFFVKSVAVGSGNCTLGNECVLATAITNSAAVANSRIFISDNGTHNGNVTLAANQWLIGQGVTGVDFDTVFGIGAPAQGTLAARPAINQAKPTIQGGAPTLTLGNTNTVRGFTLGSSTGVSLLGSSFGTLTISDVTINNGSTGQALSLTTGVLAGGAVIDSLSAAPTSGNGITLASVSNASGALTVNGGTLAAASTGPAFFVTGGSVSVTYNGSISQSGAGELVRVDPAAGPVPHTGTLIFQTGALSTTGATSPGLQFDNADGSYNFAGGGASSGGSLALAGFRGVLIQNGSSGTFAFGAGTITNPVSTAFTISGTASSPTVTGSGAISKNNAGRLIDIASLSGGSVTLSGNLSSTGATSTGISVTGSAAGTVTFSGGTKTINTSAGANDAVTITNAKVNFTNGGLAITTSSGKAYNATGGGTVTVTTGANPNTITSGTGTALTVANTAIGAAQMEFKSISASGGTSGIVLNNSSGNLIVQGDGTGQANGSGGTIQNITGGAVGNSPVYILTSSGAITLKSMNISITVNAYSGMLVDNNLGGNITVNVTGCTFTGVQAGNVTQQKSLLQFEGGNTGAGAANVTANVQNSYFFDNRTYGVAAIAAGDALMNFTLNQSGFGTDVNTGSPANNPGTTITNPPPFSALVSNSSNAKVDYSITNNTFWGADAAKGAIYVVTVSGASAVSTSYNKGSFTGNRIGKAGTVGSGCKGGCSGFGVLPGTQGTYNALVTGNDIRQTSSDGGIALVNTAGAGATFTASAIVKNNTLAEPDNTLGPLFLRAIVVSPGNSGGASTTVCAEIGGAAGGEPNIISGAWTSSFIRVTNNNNTVGLRLPGYAGGATDTAAVNAFISGRNGGASTLSTAGLVGFTGGAGCVAP